MILDPFDVALSSFIDNLPDDHQSAHQLLSEAMPFGGRGDLPELAELATMLRSVPSFQPRVEWAAESKARLMAAPWLTDAAQPASWLSRALQPLTQLRLPSLPRFALPSPMFSPVIAGLVLVLTMASVVQTGRHQTPSVDANVQQAPVSQAEQAIAATEQAISRLVQSPDSQVAGAEIEGSPKDVVLLSRQFELAEEAIDNAPPAAQPRL
ncbi:MAG TPA: hypothetical protein VKU60_13655, partial [Chloroflexota bacterium]|nr:hypothetical protein [Chloroflexota bacterium]